MNNRSQSPSSPALVRFDSIDGLRALACITVILHHCFVHAGRYTFPSISLGGRTISLPHGISYGFLGVEVFFVLSAFCLAYPLLAKNKPFSWKDYLYRRAIRILPPYWVSYLLLVLAGLVIRFTRAEPFYSSGFLQYSLRDTFNGFILRYGEYNGSFWTLCLEARWYFVLPLLLYLIRRAGWITAFVICCLISTVYYIGFVKDFTSTSKLAALVMGLPTELPFYLPTFALGLLVAKIAVAPPPMTQQKLFIVIIRSCFLIACALLNFFVPFVAGPVDLGRLVLGSIIAFTLLLLTLYDPVVRKWLSKPLIVSIGVASYSIYLVHEPLIHFTYFYTGPLHWPEPIQFLWYQILMPPLLILIGFGFFRIVEQPLLARQKALKTTPAAEAARGGVP